MGPPTRIVQAGPSGGEKRVKDMAPIRKDSSKKGLIRLGAELLKEQGRLRAQAPTRRAVKHGLEAEAVSGRNCTPPAWGGVEQARNQSGPTYCIQRADG